MLLLPKPAKNRIAVYMYTFTENVVTIEQTTKTVSPKKTAFFRPNLKKRECIEWVVSDRAIKICIESNKPSHTAAILFSPVQSNVTKLRIEGKIVCSIYRHAKLYHKCRLYNEIIAPSLRSTGLELCPNLPTMDLPNSLLNVHADGEGWQRGKNIPQGTNNIHFVQ